MKKIYLFLFISLLFLGCKNEPAVDELEPVADFTFSPENPFVNEVIQFNSHSQNAFEYRWVFDVDEYGDVTRGIPHPAFIYQKPGVYPVSLTVYSKSRKLKSTKMIEITVSKKEETEE